MSGKPTEPGISHPMFLHVVDTRKVLLTSNGRPYTRWFYDEIHPTNTGFQKVANVIEKQLKKNGAWPA